MPMEFLTDAQVAGYGRFDGVPSRAELERFFVGKLDDADRTLIGDRRGDHNRLGLMLQATTVRYVGGFLENPLDVPWPVVEYLAEQLGIADPSCVKRYPDRAMTAYAAQCSRTCPQPQTGLLSLVSGARETTPGTGRAANQHSSPAS